MPAEKPQEVPAVHPGHHEVEQDDARRRACRPEKVQRLRPLRRGLDAAAVLLEDLPQTLPEKVIVLDEKDLVHSRPLLAIGGPHRFVDPTESTF